MPATYKYFDGKKFHPLGERKTKKTADTLASRYRRQWGKGARIIAGQVLKYAVWGENIR